MGVLGNLKSSYIAKDGGSGVIVVATLYSVSIFTIFTLELRLRIVVAALLVIRQTNLPEKLSDDRGDLEPGPKKWTCYGQNGRFMSRNKIHQDSL